MSGSTGAVNGCPSPNLVDQPEPGSGAGTACQWPLVSALGFGSLPTAVASARAHTRVVLAEWDLHDLIDDAQILVNELLTNAIQASWRLDDSPPVALRLLANHHQLIIEAWDRCPDGELPPRRLRAMTSVAAA
jgi:anti-sigma regulatory factor (Ser/Thr protein kinase)